MVPCFRSTEFARLSASLKVDSVVCVKQVGVMSSMGPCTMPPNTHTTLVYKTTQTAGKKYLKVLPINVVT